MHVINNFFVLTLKSTYTINQINLELIYIIHLVKSNNKSKSTLKSTFQIRLKIKIYYEINASSGSNQIGLEINI